MKLGELCDTLSLLPDGMTFKHGLIEPHSYRGYYDQIAFSIGGRQEVTDAYLTVAGCVGMTFSGYKGGYFQMTRDTTVWIATWGDTGTRLGCIGIIGINLSLELSSFKEPWE